MWRRAPFLRNASRPSLSRSALVGGATVVATATATTLAYNSSQTKSAPSRDSWDDESSSSTISRFLTSLIPNGFRILAESAPAIPVAQGDKELNIKELIQPWIPRSRQDNITDLQNPDHTYDLLIIGGGATGAGVALDAATRGLNVAMVERDDFASGTSSRSTKLVHGGVRYLEKAFWELDYGQYKLVREAMHERSIFLHIAPHLSSALPIMLPIYAWWKIPYFWAGSKMYDMMAGKEQLQNSYFLTRKRALEEFPMLNSSELVGAMVYYDGQHNDSRMNLALAVTAAKHGATVANHVEVVRLHKQGTVDGEGSTGQICGARLRDVLTGKEWDVKAKGVVNATGPFSDSIRKLDEVSTEDMVVPSAGVHIVLPNYFAPAHMGLLDPSTSDGRVIFFLPWQGGTIAGTTDSPTDITYSPKPREEEIDWILGEVRNYLNPDVQIRREDVLAAWSGIRPLVKDPAATSTASLVRSHVVHTSPSGLVTISGGKWTTYRAMAADAVDEAVKQFNLSSSSSVDQNSTIKPCQTEKVKLIGADHYTPTMFIRLIQHFGLEPDVAEHLASNYGDRAYAVASMAKPIEGLRWPRVGGRLVHTYPYLEAEVRWAVRAEWACSIVDVIGRRLRLAFLNAKAADESLGKVADIMAEELNWSKDRKASELSEAHEWLKSMGLNEEGDKKE